MLTNRRLRWTDLVCVAAVVVLLAAALLPAVEQTQEANKRLLCAKNLRRMGLALAMYCNNETRNGFAFPRLHFDMKNADKVAFFTQWKQPNSFGQGAPESNDVTGAFYLLFKTQDLDAKTLICPESSTKVLSFADDNPKPADPTAAARTAISNFPSLEYVSYSIQNMYPSINAIQTGWKWNASIAPDFALLADLNPGGKAVASITPTSTPAEMSQANSPNHARAGQNVLYGDFHIEWHTTPFAGIAGKDGVQDNIYSRNAAAPGDPVAGPSFDRFDTILLPAADYKP